MSTVDVEKIINGTPQKILINAYDKMKENYTKDSAEEYKSFYIDKPLSFILDYSQYIFTEPYFGLPFYKNIIANPDNCLFLRLQGEYDKVVSFMDQHISNMPEIQKRAYQELKDAILHTLEHTKNTRLYASYINFNERRMLEQSLANSLYDKDMNELRQILMSSSQIAKFVYIPYIVSNTKDASFETYTNSLLKALNVEDDTIGEKWVDFVNAIICIKKLFNDDYYKNALKAFSNSEYRKVFEYACSIDLESVVNELTTVNVKESEAVFSDPVLAVNNLFADIYENTMNGDYSEKINFSDELKESILESVMNVLTVEYQTSNDLTEISTGYPLIKEGLSIESTYDEVMKALVSLNSTYLSEASDDVSDEEIDSINDDNDSLKPDNTGKKPQAPMPKNHAMAVQNKYMDKEAKQFQKKTLKKQKGQEKFNAVKAVTALPLNVARDIQQQVRNIDQADDERRKNYMTEPGFRKKWFRNLKLAILYGSAANVKLSLIPIVMTCRYFSKQKDRRIRNELVRELETDIKVTEEKISDAAASGDTKEKYRLMRIRDQLNVEMTRVRLNSKYI